MRWPCCGGQAALAAWASVTIFSGCQGAAWVSEQIGVDLKSHFLEAFQFPPKMRLLIMRLYYTNKNACSVITNVLPANGGGHSISGSCISLRRRRLLRSTTRTQLQKYTAASKDGVGEVLPLVPRRGGRLLQRHLVSPVPVCSRQVAWW
jgi:hypothetical protein